jgi:hypothetical protein
MQRRKILHIGALVALIWGMPFLGFSQPPKGPQAVPANEKLALVQAVVCERVEEGQAIHPAIVFSMSLGEIACLTSFDPVPAPAVIFHEWYKRDKLTAKTKLKLSPPRWSSVSRIQLREADKGPWRIEITDEHGNILSTLRISITD